MEERESSNRGSGPVSAEDRESAKMRRYDRMAWVLFTLPILIVIVIVRSCSGGGG